LSIDLDTKAKLPDIPSGEGQGAKQQVVDAIAGFLNHSKPPTSQQRFDFSKVAKSSDFSAASRREDFYSDIPSQPPAGSEYFQIHDSYIIAPVDDGFLIIDQHALHERIIYEDLCRRLAGDEAAKLESQKLLIPETFEINPARQEILSNSAELLERLGITIEPFGPGLWAIQSFPTLLAKVKPADFITDLLDILSDSAEKLDAERLMHRVLDMAACKAAVKAGQKLNQVEMHQLLADKEAIERASRCPHGRPTTIRFSLAELEKQFKRT
jgi:DNA mismatch repair protein MutL